MAINQRLVIIGALLFFLTACGQKGSHSSSSSLDKENFEGREDVIEPATPEQIRDISSRFEQGQIIHVPDSSVRRGRAAALRVWIRETDLWVTTVQWEIEGRESYLLRSLRLIHFRPYHPAEGEWGSESEDVRFAYVVVPAAHLSPFWEQENISVRIHIHALDRVVEGRLAVQ